MKLIYQIDSFINRHKLHFLKYVAIFAVILFGFHFLYSALINEEQVIPGLEGVYFFLQKQLFLHSAWIVENILGYEITRKGFVMTLTEHGGVEVNESCSAVKWFAHFLILMLIFPGPWKHKAWFIPAGLLITHLVNIIRIVGLSVVYVNNYDAFDFAHDYIFRPFFYFMLFLMWVIWVERFFLPAKKQTQQKLQNQ